MDTPHTHSRRVTGVVAVVATAAFVAGPVAGTADGNAVPSHLPVVQLVAFESIVSVLEVPQQSPHPGSSGAAAASAGDWYYTPGSLVQLAGTAVLLLGIALGPVVSFVQGWPAPLSEIGLSVLQGVISAALKVFEGVTFIDKQIQTLLHGSPPAATASAATGRQSPNRQEVQGSAAVSSVRAPMGAAPAALPSAANPVASPSSPRVGERHRAQPRRALRTAGRGADPMAARSSGRMDARRSAHAVARHSGAGPAVR